MRDLLLGVRFVQADGVSTWGGAKVVKSVTGYDVPKLLVGSLGTLGVLGELTLRLHPLPETEATGCFVLQRSLEAGQEIVARIVDSTLQPNRLELLDAGALAACGLPAAPAGVASRSAAWRRRSGPSSGAIAARPSQAGGRACRDGGTGVLATYDRDARRDGQRRCCASATLGERLAATIAAVRRALGADAARWW